MNERTLDRGTRVTTPESRARYATLVGALCMLAIFVVGVVVVLWQEFGSVSALPALSGQTMILYGGIAGALAILSAYTVWAWLRCRQPA
jgi:hypothetical protein